MDSFVNLRLVLYTLIWIFGIIISIQDIRSRSVSLIALLGFLISCVVIGLMNKNFAVFPLLLFGVISMLFYLCKKTLAFGIADLVVIFAVSFLITDEKSPLFILLCGAFGILTAAIFKQQKFPFIPAILASSCIVRSVNL